MHVTNMVASNVIIIYVDLQSMAMYGELSPKLRGLGLGGIRNAMTDYVCPCCCREGFVPRSRLN